MEAIILAGGLGTRLSKAVPNLPKVMAPINGIPFLQIILDYLFLHKVSHIVLAIGYKGSFIQECFLDSYKGMRIAYSVEDMPLGTGGAIKKAFKACKENDFFVLNGDTYFDVDLGKMMDFHKTQKSALTIAVKPMIDFERYGKVVIKDEKVVRFEEKKKCSKGNINGGVYLLNRCVFEDTTEECFSFEKNILENSKTAIFAFVSEGFFIDIGIPEDYEKAKTVFSKGYINEQGSLLR